jgi:hypothetical protein
MDKLLYKGYVVLDNLRNSEKQKKRKNDYLFVKREETEDGNKQNKVKLRNYKISVPRENEMSSVKILNEREAPESVSNGRGHGVLPKGQLPKKVSIRSPTHYFGS